MLVSIEEIAGIHICTAWYCQQTFYFGKFWCNAAEAMNTSSFYCAQPRHLCGMEGTRTMKSWQTARIGVATILTDGFIGTYGWRFFSEFWEAPCIYKKKLNPAGWLVAETIRFVPLISIHCSRWSVWVAAWLSYWQFQISLISSGCIIVWYCIYVKYHSNQIRLKAWGMDQTTAQPIPCFWSR